MSEVGETYLVVDGVKIPLTDEQVAMIKGAGAQAKKTAFSRAKEGEFYWLISDNCVVEEAYEAGFGEDEERFKCANYCTDRRLIEERAIREELSRLLWRFSMENGGENIDWKDFSQIKYSIYIYFDDKGLKWEISHDVTSKCLNEIYFIDENTARRAIREIVEPFCADDRIREVIMRSKG